MAVPTRVVRMLLVLAVLRITDICDGAAAGSGEAPCVGDIPCQNSGSCDSVNSKCICSIGFTGSYCETSMSKFLGIEHIQPAVFTSVVADQSPSSAPQLFRLVSYPCGNVKANPPNVKYQWYHNGVLVDPKLDQVYEISEADGKLTLRYPGSREKYEGNYQCKASNEHGASIGTAVNVKFKVYGGFTKVPDIVYNVTINKGLTIKCPPHREVYGYTAQWINETAKGAVAVFNNTRVFQGPGGTLHFAYVTEDDVRYNADGFTCRFGTFVKSTTRIRLANVGVSSDNFLNLNLKAETFFLKKSQGKTFHCFPTGRPSPSVTWSVDGKPVRTSQQYNLKDNGRTLVLAYPNPSMTIACSANNSAGSIASAGPIKVFAPEGSVLATKMYVTDGDARLALTTGIQGLSFGYPNVTWYYNGHFISGDVIRSKFQSRITIDGNDKSLTLNNPRLSDSGVYQSMINGVAVYASYEVYVAGAPVPPVSLTVTNCHNLSTTLTWTPSPKPGINSPSSYVIEIANDYQPHVYTKKETVMSAIVVSRIITGLSPWANYTFRIRAVNSKGTGFPSLPTDSSRCITRFGAPSTFPPDLKANPLRPTGSLNISWGAFPKIQWNHPNCIILVFYKRSNESKWTNHTKLLSCSTRWVAIDSLGSYVLMDAKIRAQSPLGQSPESPQVQAFTGQPRPMTQPKDVIVYHVSSHAVFLRWSPITVSGGSIDGYQVSCSGGDIDERESRKPAKRSISEADQIQKSGRFPLSDVLSRGSSRIRRDLPLIPGGCKLVRTTETSFKFFGLIPLFTYRFFVVGYNSGGSGFPTQMQITTLALVDSSYIVTLVVKSETFTPEFKDKTSAKYQQLSSTLLTGFNKKLRRAPPYFWYRFSEFLSFSNGSVKAEVQVVAASPRVKGELLVEFTEGIGVDDFPSYTVDNGQTVVILEKTFSRPHVNVSDTFPFPDDTIIFRCTASGPRLPVFSWFKDSKPITWGVRHKIESNREHVQPWSQLTIRNVTSDDQGNYTCMTSKGNQNSTTSVNVDVRPVIDIVPKTVTKQEGESVEFKCYSLQGSIRGLEVHFNTFTPNGDVILSEASHVDKLTLPRVRVEPEDRYWTVVRFQCLVTEQRDANITTHVSPLAELTVIKPGVPRCPSEKADRILWSTTAVNKTDIHLCPGKATGQATRSCLQSRASGAVWGPTNFANCTSLLFKSLKLEANAITSGFLSSLNTSDLLATLANATLTSVLYGGDLDIAIEILTMLTEYNMAGNRTVFMRPGDMQNFVEVASNVLNLENAKIMNQYQAMENKGSRGLWGRLISTCDTFGLQIASTMRSDGGRKIVTRNINMGVNSVSSDSTLRQQGLRHSSKDSSILLPGEVFRSSQTTHVVNMIYGTLNSVMRLAEPFRNSTNSSAAPIPVPANTSVITSVVQPEPPAVLRHGKVKIRVQNKQIVDPVPARTCVYWKSGLSDRWKTRGCRLVPSESNSDVTTCECDHLTVFASLMDPFGGRISAADQKALELISTIGCAISLFAVIITILVTVIFWRSLKGPRAIVLLNICITIAVVCILVIAEGTARNTKDGCKALAILLHYFLLAVFCWMLCEAGLLYLIIVKVLGGKPEEKIKYFLAFGWGFPALIVAISLAATQTDGYGYHGSQQACWLSVDTGLIWAFVGPAITVLLINILVFALVIRQMMGTRHMQTKSRDEKARTAVKATAVILPLLGITWIFGLLAFNSDTVAFKYIFAILNSLQGLMIFIFHCLLNKQVQDAVKRRYRHTWGSDTSGAGYGTGGKNKDNKSKVQSGIQSEPRKHMKNDYEMRPSTASTPLKSPPGTSPIYPDVSAISSDDVVVYDPDALYDPNIKKTYLDRDHNLTKYDESQGYLNQTFADIENEPRMQELGQTEEVRGRSRDYVVDEDRGAREGGKESEGVRDFEAFSHGLLNEGFSPVFEVSNKTQDRVPSIYLHETSGKEGEENVDGTPGEETNVGKDLSRSSSSNSSTSVSSVKAKQDRVPSIYLNKKEDQEQDAQDANPGQPDIETGLSPEGQKLDKVQGELMRDGDDTGWKKDRVPSIYLHESGTSGNEDVKPSGSEHPRDVSMNGPLVQDQQQQGIDNQETYVGKESRRGSTSSSSSGSSNGSSQPKRDRVPSFYLHGTSGGDQPGRPGDDPVDIENRVELSLEQSSSGEESDGSDLVSLDEEDLRKLNDFGQPLDSPSFVSRAKRGDTIEYTVTQDVDEGGEGQSSGSDTERASDSDTETERGGVRRGSLSSISSQGSVQEYELVLSEEEEESTVVMTGMKKLDVNA